VVRSDLQALTLDDLAVLTNRGTVKHAQRELASGEPSSRINENEERLTVTWSDGIVCTFAAGETIHDAHCSSGVVGISRHIVRSVLAYQLRHRANNPLATEAPDEDADAKGETEQEVGVLDAWDPGEFTDDDLIKLFRKAAITRARKVFENGVLAELTRGAKPVVRFLHESCTVRFPVSGDLRYATADCSESLLSLWIPQAVWAFRDLPSGRMAGLLSIQQAELATPHDELKRLEELIFELCREGLCGVSATWPQRMTRLEKQLRSSGLVWPAELTADIVHQYERYQQHDARFEALELVRLVGELIARSRSIRSQNGSVPQPLVRGSKSDRRTDIKGGRFIGVGLGVRLGRQHTTLQAFLQNTESGTVVAIEQTFNDPYPEYGDEPRSFSDLATHSLSRGISLGSVSLSQLLLSSGKQTPTDELVLPRGTSKLMINPQTFQWEQLKPPFAVETFAQLRQRFESLPPDWLRPRRRTENLHVVCVMNVADVDFDVVTQQLTATLHDRDGGTAKLMHSFHTRGQDGFHDLATVLETRGAQIRFVCGHFRLVSGELCIQPISVVLDEGKSRIAISPWLANPTVLAETQKYNMAESDVVSSPIVDFTGQLRHNIAEILLTGLRQVNPDDWADLSRTGRYTGFVRLADVIETLSKELDKRSNHLRWDSSCAANLAAQLCMLTRMLD